jgi:hypothetical protein
MLIRNFLNLCHLSEFLDTVSNSSSYYMILSKNGNIIDLSNTEAGNARNISCLIPSNLIIKSNYAGQFAYILVMFLLP